MELILYVPKGCFVLGRNPLNTVCYCIESESESHSVESDSLRPHGLYSPWNSPGQNAGVGCLSRLQGIFPTQGSNPGLLHCRQILHQLSYCTEVLVFTLIPGGQAEIRGGGGWGIEN